MLCFSFAAISPISNSYSIGRIMMLQWVTWAIPASSCCGIEPADLGTFSTTTPTGALSMRLLPSRPNNLFPFPFGTVDAPYTYFHYDYAALNQQQDTPHRSLEVQPYLA